MFSTSIDFAILCNQPSINASNIFSNADIVGKDKNLGELSGRISFAIQTIVDKLHASSLAAITKTDIIVDNEIAFNVDDESVIVFTITEALNKISVTVTVGSLIWRGTGVSNSKHWSF